jgi:hypothetical protein
VGLISSISHVAHSVGHVIAHPKEAAQDLEQKVQDAPSNIAHGAHDALLGAKYLGTQAIHKAHEGAVAFQHDPIKATIAGAKLLGKGAKEAGKWSWHHKAEIGFWVGTTALLMAVPVSGGASGALAGGMMAARGAAIAARVAEAGRAGATAVKLARAGATAVRAAKEATAATKFGRAAAVTGRATYKGREWLGASRGGKLMLKAEKPVMAVSTGLAGVNLADTSVQYTRGKASKKDLAFAALGFAPTGVGTVRALAARRAATANVKAAEVASDRLGVVANKAADATHEAAHVAAAAPRVNAPQTANAAAAAQEDALGTVHQAVRLRQRTELTQETEHASDAISATSLQRELDHVANRATVAKQHADTARELAPDALTPAASAASDQLDEVAAIAAGTRNEIAGLAKTQRRADLVERGAEKVKTAVGTTSLHANMVNNGMLVSRDHRNAESAFARNVGFWLLGRNARAYAPATG